MSGSKQLTILKSPLRYPGGKSKAVPQIIDSFIRKQETLCSPFVGGGSVEIELANRGTRVYAYDVFTPLVVFWQELLQNSVGLANKVKEYKLLSKTKFYNLQKSFLNLKNRREIASAFFVLNRASFSGTTLSGGMSPGHPRFTESSIERLEAFKVPNLSVDELDFKESIPLHKTDFLYCDPPYLINRNLYGIKGSTRGGFDHESLADLLRSRDGWVLSYNDRPEIRSMYEGHPIIKPEWAYGMNKTKKSSELLILSKDFREVV